MGSTQRETDYNICFFRMSKSIRVRRLPNQNHSWKNKYFRLPVKSLMWEAGPSQSLHLDFQNKVAKKKELWACSKVFCNAEYKIDSDVICSSLRASVDMTARSQHEWDTILCAMRLSQRSFLRFSYSRVVQLFPGPSISRDEGTGILRNVGTTDPLTRRHISRRDPIRYRAASQLYLRQTPSVYGLQF
jgi:hypothetical protein